MKITVFLVTVFVNALASAQVATAPAGLAQEIPAVPVVVSVPELPPSAQAKIECRQRTLRPTDQYATLLINADGTTRQVNSRYSTSPVLGNMVFSRTTGPGDRAHTFVTPLHQTLRDLEALVPQYKSVNEAFLPTSLSAEVKQLKQDNLFVLNNLFSGNVRTDWFDTSLSLQEQSTIVFDGENQLVDEASGRFVSSRQTLYIASCPKFSTEGCRAFNVLNERITERNGTENVRFEAGHFVCRSNR